MFHHKSNSLWNRKDLLLQAYARLTGQPCFRFLTKAAALLLLWNLDLLSVQIAGGVARGFKTFLKIKYFRETLCSPCTDNSLFFVLFNFLVLVCPAKCGKGMDVQTECGCTVHLFMSSKTGNTARVRETQ